MLIFFEHKSIKGKISISLIFLLSLLFLEVFKEFYVSVKIEKIQTELINQTDVNDKLIALRYAIDAEMQSYNTLKTISNGKMFESYWSEHKRIVADTRNHFLQLKSLEQKDSTIKSLSIFPVIDTIIDVQLVDIQIIYLDFFNAKSEQLRVSDINVFDIDPNVELGDFFTSLSDTIFEKTAERFLENSTIKYAIAIDSTYNKINHKITKASNELKKEILFNRDDVFMQIKYSNNSIIITLILGIILSAFIITILSKSILKPITALKKQVSKLSKGQLPKNLEVRGKDEFSKMAKELNILATNLQKVSDFSLEIGTGNYTGEFKPFSDEDVLGNALIDMRERLKKAEEITKKRNADDKIRTWIATGHSKISEILQQQKSIDELSYDLIKYIIKYIGANVGGVFILDNISHIPALKLSALHAYNRRRRIERQIIKGEGLLWSCVHERETIYTTDLPNDYVEIKSGLGESPPKALLIVPLKTENDILGIMEIAAINNIQEHKIKFVERVAEYISASFANKIMSMNASNLRDVSFFD